MKIDALHTTAYRMLTPRWSHAPLSGAGAALYGGRANRPGVEALYLALDHETAIEEYKQLSPLMPPGTLVTYQLHIRAVVNFSAGFDSKTWEMLWEDFHCDWRAMWFDRRIEPPSWIIGDEVIAAGGNGILFSSVTNPGGVNLVLYPATLTSADTIEVYDPHHDLPKDQSSWTTV